MRLPLPLLVGAVVGLFLSLIVPSLAQAQTTAQCFPACRAGYLCNPEGKCVSECNPPCASGETCRAAQCAVSASSEQNRSAEPDAAPVRTEPEPIEMVLAGGIGAHVSTVTAPVVLTSFSVALGGRHAFLAGVQGCVAFFDGYFGTGSYGEVGLNLGYRGIFTHGEVGAGILVVAQPQIWFGPEGLLGLGGAVGGVITYKRLVIEVPLGLSRVSVFKNFSTTSKHAVVFTPAVFAGVSF